VSQPREIGVAGGRAHLGPAQHGWHANRKVSSAYGVTTREEGRQMSVFTVDLKNQPGELARLCEAMAGRGVNLVLSATAGGEKGTVAFIADDEPAAEAALEGAGIEYTRRPALTIRMENQPGTGAATFRKLARAGVNAELLLPVRVSDELFFAVMCVDDQDKARDALGDQVAPDWDPAP
jgi:hypothetical protein